MADRVLVTGATGFIGSHCILEMLAAGYEVRGTMRDLSRVDKLRETLAKHSDRAGEVEFVAASLDSRDGWLAAAEGCHGILHVASPVPAVQPKDPAEIIDPARNGTLHVLGAAREAGVRRVVLTSSVAAVMGTRRVDQKTYTADDWSDPDDPELTPYPASKTVSERAAWDFVETDGPELVTVNPGVVLGPVLGADYSLSLETLIKLFTGEVPMVPHFGFEIVDVRDVAVLHRLALEKREAAGKRLLCGAGFRWFIDVARQLKHEYPDRRIPTRGMPNFLVSLFAIFVPEMRYFKNDLDAVKKVDCTPALELGWEPRSPEEAVLAGARSLVDLGIV